MDQPIRKTTREDYEERLIRVQLYIHEHLEEPLPLGGLAQEACFSRFHFHRIFLAMVGETPLEFIRRLRLERGAAQLANADSPIGEVALNAGYESPEAFSRAFHQRYGMPPAKYREHHFDGSGAAGMLNPEFVPVIKRGEGVAMKVKLEKLGPWTVAYLRHTGPYDQCSEAWTKLIQTRCVKRAFRFGTLMFGLCYDDPEKTAPGDIRMDVCITVGKGFKPEDGVERQEIEAGEYAVLRHTGSYSNLSESYNKLYGEWLPDNGREPADRPSLEIYRNNPNRVREHKLITDICIPLK